MTQGEKYKIVNYTSIEQSKKLLELGLNPETADMWYSLDENDLEHSIVYVGNEFDWSQIDFNRALPCWSIGALLELLPLSIVGWDNETYTRYFIGNCAEYATGTSKYDKGLISIPSDSMFKCVYSMVCWLLQNNYIKTE